MGAVQRNNTKEVIVIEQNVLPRKLIGMEKLFIKIPRDVIRNENQRLVITYIFFAMRHGLDNTIDFTLNSLITWCGYTPDNKPNRVNDNFIQSIQILINLGYISLDITQLLRKGSNVITATFESDYVDEVIENEKQNIDNDGLFAILYVDEIKKILSYSFDKQYSKYNNVSNLFIVFAYLRSMIYLNGNTNSSQPEAYYEYYFEIANKIHMTSKTFSKLVSILNNELNLIYYRHIRKKTTFTKSGWVTLPTVFANTYCRSNGKVWGEGREYCLEQIENKMKLMGEKFVFNTMFVKKDTSCEEKESNESKDWIDLI